jgi:hypothetical protein
METRHIALSRDGIDRRHLPNFVHLGTITQTMADEALALARHLPDLNDIEDGKYCATQLMPLCRMKPARYRQILLQELAPESSERAKFFDNGYTNWNARADDLSLCRWLKGHFATVWRCRIAELPAGSEIPWHIDTNTSVACRVTVNVSPVANRFEIDRKGEVEVRYLEPLSVYFTNTGFKHRVVNENSEARTSVLFSCDSRGLFPFKD